MVRRHATSTAVARPLAPKKKGRSRERPKSREETPKEGCKTSGTAACLAQLSYVATQYLSRSKTPHECVARFCAALGPHPAVNDVAQAKMPDGLQGHPQKKKWAIQRYGRPKSREETPKEGYDRRASSPISQCESNGCGAQSSIAIFAMQLEPGRGACPDIQEQAQKPGPAARELYGYPQKEAVRNNERPKSREETPVVGYGIEEVLLSTVISRMRLFAECSNPT